jgi:hypothetical protein
VIEFSDETNAFQYRELKNTSRLVYIATILGKTGEHGSGREMWIFDWERLGGMLD